MIADHIRNAALYYGMSPRLAKALRYLAETDFSRIAPGKVDLDGADLYAMISEYTTKPVAETKWEAHRKYIDVQFLVTGQEGIAVADLPTLKPAAPYDEAKDFQLLEGSGWSLSLKAHMFAIFFPHDAHMPCIAEGAPAPVRKVVVKVRARAMNTGKLFLF